MKQYLITFIHRHLDFRVAEFDAILKLFNIPCRFIDPLDAKKSFAVVELESEADVKKILSRCVLVKCICELWARATSYDKLVSLVRNVAGNYQPFYATQYSWCMRLESFSKKQLLDYKVRRFEEFAFLPMEGPVNLENPNIVYQITEFYGINPNEAPEEPLEVFFGRLIGYGQHKTAEKYNLKQRVYIGNTSMDPVLALIMGNMGMARSSSLVYDPFVGTGSLLIAAAHFGAFTLGADISYPVLHARTKPSRHGLKSRDPDESLLANFVQYNLTDLYLGSVIADASRKALWRRIPFFDAIITDPPYGLREKGTQLGAKRPRPLQIGDDANDEENPSSTTTTSTSTSTNTDTTTMSTGTTDTSIGTTSNCESVTAVHFPEKQKYRINDVYLDLLDFAAESLVVGGRLVYWFPVVTEEYEETRIPRHDALKLIANCEQKLMLSRSRRLIVMEKERDCKSDDHAFVLDESYVMESYRERAFK